MADIVPIHVELGASQAHRWIPCSGSVSLIATLPPGMDEGSVYAQEGTAAHELARKCLMTKPGELIDPSVYEGTEIEGVYVDDDMVQSVWIYLDHCWKLIGPNTLYWVEKQFSLGKLNPPAPMFGTADFAAYTPETATLDVVDLKYGKGVVVEVSENPQTRYYGIGAVMAVQEQLESKTGKMPEIERVRLTIVQPRATHPDGLVRTEELEYVDLLFYSRELLEYAHATLNPNAPRVAGDHCRFCRAAAICPEKKAHAVAVAKTEFDPIEPISPPDPSALTIEEVSYILTQLPALEEWIEQLKTYATAMLKKGQAVPGFKLVAKRANRAWKDETMLKKWADMLGYDHEELYEKKLLSPAKAEKKFGKKNVPEDLYHKPSSGSKLAFENDTRPAVDPANEFKGLPLPE